MPGFLYMIYMILYSRAGSFFSKNKSFLCNRASCCIIGAQKKEDNPFIENHLIREERSMYQFPDQLRATYESMRIPFAMYQYLNEKVVPVLVSDGLCDQMEIGRAHV